MPNFNIPQLFNLIQDFDKQLIQLHSKLQVLRDAKRALPMIPLKEPYQKGWKRTFVLREDVRISKYATFYETLLTKINSVMYWQNKTFTKTRRRKRKKVQEPIEQTLKSFSLREWEHIKNPLTEAERKCFHTEKHWLKNSDVFEIYYVFNEPWRYVLKIEPHIIAEVKMLDEVLEQQIGELKKLIYNNNYGHKIEKLNKGRVSNWRRDLPERPWEVSPHKNKAKHTIPDASED